GLCAGHGNVRRDADVVCRAGRACAQGSRTSWPLPRGTRMSRAITDTRLDRLFREAGDVLERHERAGLTRDLTLYADNPVGFATDVLHVEPWSKQIAMLDAVLRERRVSVRGGVGVGKDFTAAGVSLGWAY